MRMSSTLNVPRSIRSINVRANILTEWTADQIRLRAETTKYLAGTALCLAMVGAGVPLCETARGGLLALQQKRLTQLGGLKTALAERSAAQKARRTRRCRLDASN